MKSGSTALSNYLMQHPYIKIPVYQKEVHFFDVNFQRGISWYKSFFPTKFYKYFMEKFKTHKLLTGEKSPYYIFHPHAPIRIFSILPNVKIIILLRNPVNRAYSHYQHSKRNKRESLSFEEAIKVEPERLKGELDKMINSKTYKSYNYGHYSYLSRGIYINQIKLWFEHFPKEQVIILKSEDLFENPQSVLNRIYEFLDIPKIRHKGFKKIFTHEYEKINKKTREYLKDYFRPYNEQLYEYLGLDFNWEDD